MVLPVCGLSIFALLTYRSFEFNQHIQRGRYFWWSAERLDTDPLGKHPQTQISDEKADSIPTEPIYIDMDPGWLVKVLTLAALPAYLAGTGIVRELARLGVSEVVTFMASMPILIAAWFYLVGWFVDRRRNQHRA